MRGLHRAMCALNLHAYGRKHVNNTHAWRVCVHCRQTLFLEYR